LEPTRNEPTDTTTPEGGEAASEVEVIVEQDPADADERGDGGATEEHTAPPPPDPRELRIRTLERQLGEREATLHAYIKAHKKAEQEFEAFKERTRRDREREVTLARGKVVERLLEVDEHLERTIQATAQGATAEQLIEGLRLVHRIFIERLTELGLERVDPTGLAFDPTTMEALGVAPVTDPALDGKVVHTLKAGFRIGEQEIRPALVQVGRKV